mmetsp:Transcript_80597/g.228310  ORF Transcript_80597/g.228310 Transcript_80597/m.228310 type:complete len:245 (-) Transcript_80597:844-1578(-)
MSRPPSARSHSSTVRFIVSRVSSTNTWVPFLQMKQYWSKCGFGKNWTDTCTESLPVAVYWNQVFTGHDACSAMPAYCLRATVPRQCACMLVAAFMFLQSSRSSTSASWATYLAAMLWMPLICGTLVASHSCFTTSRLHAAFRMCRPRKIPWTSFATSTRFSIVSAASATMSSTISLCMSTLLENLSRPNFPRMAFWILVAATSLQVASTPHLAKRSTAAGGGGGGGAGVLRRFLPPLGAGFGAL